ncbi:hypothetical protein B0O99DRAFT_599368 [Bisporella sp. PMI_857]|nr:hypothetical protein B0O99DRAFT_599368 [Bisporella sp. PMI_857]
MSRQITPLQQAYLDAYAAACALVPRNLRQTLILFWWCPNDVDILVGIEVLAILDDAIINKREGFHRDHDGTIKWDKCDSKKNKLFEVIVELVEIGGPFVPRIPEVVGFGEGYVATLPELVRLRASTLVERGDESDYIDFVLLVSSASKRRIKLPHLGEEELKSMIEAVEMCERSRDMDELFMDILGSFEFGGIRFENWVAWAHHESL